MREAMALRVRPNSDRKDSGKAGSIDWSAPLSFCATGSAKSNLDRSVGASFTTHLASKFLAFLRHVT